MSGMRLPGQNVLLVLACVGLWLSGWSAGAATGSGGDSPAGLELQIERLNRGYEGLVEELPPLSIIGIDLRLTAGEHRLTLVAHRLHLRPAGEPGLHHARLEFEFRGRGTLEIRGQGNGSRFRFEDEVTAPQQRRSLAGRVRIRPVEGGYLVTTEAHPESLQVELRSRLAGRLVGWCRQMTGWMPASGDCGVFERAFSEAQIPLPPPGETFLLSADELSDGERSRLDDYLAWSQRG